MAIDTVFFDIGQTLGVPSISPAGRLERLALFPGVADALAELRTLEVRLGIISNIGPVTDENVAAVREALADAGILDSFAPELLVFGAKDSPEIFTRAAALAGHENEPAKCAFVGETQAERDFAHTAGIRVTDRVSAAPALVRDEEEPPSAPSVKIADNRRGC